MARVQELGRNLAAEAGRVSCQSQDEEARYRGPEGMCPVCHLNAFNIVGAKGEADCATCGAKGRLEVDPEVRQVKFVTDAEGEDYSVLRMAGLERHLRDLQAAFQLKVDAGAEATRLKEELTKLGQTWILMPPSLAGA